MQKRDFPQKDSQQHARQTCIGQDIFRIHHLHRKKHNSLSCLQAMLGCLSNFFSFTSCSALESSSKMWAIGLLQSQVDTFQSKYLVVSIYVHSDTGQIHFETDLPVVAWPTFLFVHVMESLTKINLDSQFCQAFKGLSQSCLNSYV